LVLQFGLVRREWSSEDLIASWTLIDDDWRLVGNKSGATRLGFALILKFFEIEARFPRSADEFPAAAVAYVADQVKVDPVELADYRWAGRTLEYHRAQVRDAFGLSLRTPWFELTERSGTCLSHHRCDLARRDALLRTAPPITL
jgi:Domain of unknown function (DUF4158)